DDRAGRAWADDRHVSVRDGYRARRHRLRSGGGMGACAADPRDFTGAVEIAQRGARPMRRTRPIILQVALTALGLLSLAPFVWLVCATIKGKDDFFATSFLPRDPRRWTFAN